MEHPRDHIRGEDDDRGVIGTDGIVEILPPDAQFVLGFGDLVHHHAESGGGKVIGLVVFDHGHHVVERGDFRAVGGGILARVGSPGACDGGDDRLLLGQLDLERGVKRSEFVVAFFEEILDLGVTGIHGFVLADEAVVIDQSHDAENQSEEANESPADEEAAVSERKPMCLLNPSFSPL